MVREFYMTLRTIVSCSMLLVLACRSDSPRDKSEDRHIESRYTVTGRRREYTPLIERVGRGDGPVMVGDIAHIGPPLLLRSIDETRFHERRLDIYAEFTGAANEAVSEALAGTPQDNTVAQFMEIFEKVRLVATEDVSESADAVRQTMGVCRVSQKDAEENADAFNMAMAILVVAMWSELGTGRMLGTGR